MKKKTSFRVTGRVQGVFFRACAEDAARRLGVTGWIRNAPDGSVEGEAYADSAALEKFIGWLHEGSPHSRVDRVDITGRGAAQGAPLRFEVRH